MGFENIELIIVDGYATLTLNRPDSLNSFNKAMHGEVKAALQQVETDENVRALLITGAGRGFCAGQDLSERRAEPGGDPFDLGNTVANLYNPLVRKLRSLPMPVVCAVNGVAAGAGANIAFACDIVLAAKSAKFIQAFCKLGLVPDSGGTWTLPRLVGHARAFGLTLLGDAVMAEQAEAWGMIWKCIDDDDLMDEARSMCARFAIQPTFGLAQIKKALNASWSHSLDEQLDLERDLQRECGRSEDFQEGVAAFMEKRDPRFKGR